MRQCHYDCHDESLQPGRRTGFIRLNALRLKVAAKVQRRKL
jgi:hypothetical protein